MKLCKDCRWLIPPANAYGLCGHPQAVWQEQSPVTGKTVEHRWTCETFRMSHLMRRFCGPDAKLFEPRDDEPQTIPDRGFE